MPLTKADFKKDQVVACKHTGNLARRNKGYTLGKVKSVGKYITVDLGSGTHRFQLDETSDKSFLLEKEQPGGPDYYLFPSEQAYLEHEEKLNKLAEIKTAVAPTYSNSKLTLEQVKRIYEIINE